MSLPIQTSKPLEQKLSKSQVAAAQIFNPSTLEPEVEGSLWVWDQPALQSKFEVSQGYTEKHCFEPHPFSTPQKTKQV